MSDYIMAELLCPVCGCYLLDKQIGTEQYKSCNSCGYARKNENSVILSVLGDDVGNGIDPLIDQDSLKRPEDRGQKE